MPLERSDHHTDAAYTRPVPASEGVGWLRRLWPFLRRYRGTLLAALAVSVVAQGLIALLPLLQKVIVDDAIVERERSLGPLLVLLIAVGAAGFAANWTRRYLAGKVTVDVQYDMRRAIHRRLYE